MWDHANEQTFTRAEAVAMQGQTVNTSAKTTATIKGMFCVGPDSYVLSDERGNMLYRSHSNCPYVVG